MKYLLAALFAIPLFITNATAQHTTIYTGKLGNEQIELHLRTIKNDIYGYYFVKGTNKLLPLNGEKKGNKLRIKEYEDLDGFIYLEATQKDKTLTGERIDSMDNTVAKKFTLTETGAEVIDKVLDSLSGDFRIADYNNGIVKDVSIYFLSNQYAYFELGISYPNCTGNINGIAQVSGNTLVFSSSQCQNLTFTLHNSSVHVKEEHCTPHGKTCDFNGKYFRQ